MPLTTCRPTGRLNGDVFVNDLRVLAWTLVAPILAAPLPATTERPRGGGLAHLLAAVLFAVAVFAGFSLAAVVLPPGS